MKTASALLVGVALGGLGCAGFETEPPEATPRQAVCAAEDDEPLTNRYPTDLHVVGNHIEDGDGQPLFIRGVNRSGSEYHCVKGYGFFDGPCDEASVRAMVSWGINAVRVPLNESCWLGINGVSPTLGGTNYQAAIRSYVHLLHKYALIPILDLHWSMAGDLPAIDLAPMPNANHSPRLWREVAEAFADDTGVIFEPFNEPFPDGNRDTTEAWACWRDGCEVPSRDEKTPAYQAAGMQELVTTIREAGATQLILLGGVQYSNSLSRWAEYAPADPLQNLAPAWHIYDFNRCSNASCWNGAPLELGERLPIVATEIGQSNCQDDFLKPLMAHLDATAAGYLAWSWNAYGECVPRMGGGAEGNPWSLIDSFETARPNSAYALAFRDHALGTTQ